MIDYSTITKRKTMGRIINEEIQVHKYRVRVQSI